MLWIMHEKKEKEKKREWRELLVVAEFKRRNHGFINLEDEAIFELGSRIRHGSFSSFGDSSAAEDVGGGVGGAGDVGELQHHFHVRVLESIPQFQRRRQPHQPQLWCQLHPP